MRSSQLINFFKLVFFQIGQINFNKQQLLFLSEAFKEIGSGLMVVILLAGLIEGSMNYFQVLISFIFVFIAWYIGLKIIKDFSND